MLQEDAHPIAEIIRQTPDLPAHCQWAIFLRNHDELTLESVTDEERDSMYRTYAAEPQMRINAGIRRRLAPLLENSRERIQLANSLLLSLPGTPVLYYGDEIGMGDNIYLGDRNGVRTPMQWTSDRNAGFSSADPARLFAPLVMDPVYGYQAINVEAQERLPASLLNWTKRMIAIRRQHRAFGRGAIQFLRSSNPHVLAYVRQFDGEILLCVANLSRHPQPSMLDLHGFEGRVPVELLGQTPFPRVDPAPYAISLGSNGFYWFRLREYTEPQAVVRPVPVLDAEAARRSRRAAAARARVDLRVRERDAADPGARLPASPSRDTALVRRESPGTAPGAHPRSRDHRCRCGAGGPRAARGRVRRRRE